MTNLPEFHLSGDGPLQHQVYDVIKHAILDGRMNPGGKLPSSRSLAESLDVSRMTTLLAYERLAIDGYVVTRKGAGTFVAAVASIAIQKKDRKVATLPRLPSRVRELSQLADSVPVMQTREVVVDFRYSQTDESGFPHEDWAKSVRSALGKQQHRYPDPMGSDALRQTLQQYLLRRYGMTCDWQDIMIVNGSQQALHLCAQVLTEAGDLFGMEDPGYALASILFNQYGLKRLPLPVDEHGIITESLLNIKQSPRMVYVTPGHQFPLGGVLPIERRLSLLENASAQNYWLLEDDYDSEYRHNGSPVPPIKVLDEDDRVVHIGTFSKTIDPGLRLGYMVLPRVLVKPFSLMRALNDQGSALLNQLALTEFIRRGFYERHLRRIRRAHSERRQTLIAVIAKEMGDSVTVSGSDTGSHIVLWLHGIPFSRSNDIVQRIYDEGIVTQPLTQFYSHPPQYAGLLLGYGNLTRDEITTGIKKIAATLREFQSGIA